jgi:hypothetical protein
MTMWQKKNKIIRFLGLVVVTTLLWLTLSTHSWAELPPSAYRQLQKNAAEVLVIKVDTVQTKTQEQPKRKLIRVNAQAQVREVFRTKTGLKPGALIQIRYEHSQFKNPMPGPSQIPILKPGQVLPAYLMVDRNKKEYLPVAGGYSFNTVP